MESASAGGAGLASGPAFRCFRSGGPGPFPQSLEGAGCLCSGDSGSQSGEPRPLPGGARLSQAIPGPGNPRVSVTRDAAPRHADVHQLWLVFRRAFRNRNRAGDPLRGAGAAARGATYRPVLGRRVSESPPAGQEQSSRALRRAGHLPEVDQAGHGGPRKGRRALRGEFHVRAVSGNARESIPTR